MWNVTGGYAVGTDSSETFRAYEEADGYNWPRTGTWLIYGNGGNDSLHGDEGADWITGGAGADRLWGHGGFDIADYIGSVTFTQHHPTTGLTADLLLTSNNTGEAAGDSYNSIEGLSGTNLGDTLRGDHNDNRLLGNNGRRRRGHVGDGHRQQSEGGCRRVPDRQFRAGR